MSTELTTPIKIEIPCVVTIESSDLYLKSEADKVIEDITKGAISMFRESSCRRGFDMKSSLGKIADVAFKHWNHVESIMSNNRQLRLDKATILYSNEQLRLQLKSETLERQNDKIEYALNIRHQKHKRCLAMVKYCHESAMWLEECGVTKSAAFMLRWEKRWLELAERFK